VHWDTIKASVIAIGDDRVRLRLYRFPGTVTSAFTEHLSNLFDHLVLLDSQFVVLGDFNAPGVTDVFIQHGLRQHVSNPTRGNLTSGNLLDLVLSLDQTV